MTSETATKLSTAAERYAWRFRRFPMVEQDDLIGAAILAAVKAERSFDPKRGMFEHYAHSAMRSAIARQAYQLASPTGGNVYAVECGKLHEQQRVPHEYENMVTPPNSLRERIHVAVRLALIGVKNKHQVLPILLGEITVREAARKANTSLDRMRLQVSKIRAVLQASHVLQALWEETLEL